MTVASSPVHALAGYRAEFPIFERRIYLNSCSLGALSRRSRAWVDRFLEEWQERGAAPWYDIWWDRMAALRKGYARIVGGRETEIALHASVSTAAAVVASALDYRARPKIVTTALDFPTVTYQWLARRPEGVEVEILESPDGITVRPEQIREAVDERTALVATSHVYFTTGAIQDVRAVADAAHAVGALCFIDAYQSVGQMPVDVGALGVDFLCAGGLKWLLGGPGITFLYVREALIPSLVPRSTGWFAHANQFSFDPRHLEFHADARRYELGTPALAAVHAQLGGLEIVEEIGVAQIRAVVNGLVADLIARAREAGLQPRVAPTEADRAAIVTLPVPDPRQAVAKLGERGIVADARRGHVRLSPFFYNVVEDHVGALEVLGH